MNAEEIDPISFEETFGRLQQAIAQLEQGGLTLHDAIETFERGMTLAGRCETILNEAELRITRILEDTQIDRDEPAF